MPSLEDVRWFKAEFESTLNTALVGLPLSVDFMTALACQETGEVWPTLRRAGLPIKTILQLCVGDTLDFDKGRRAFPQTKDELIAAPDGQQMFDIARKALVDMAKHIPSYRPAAAKPNKFCHGFGLFQRDLQFFRTAPAYFLNQDYEQFDKTLAAALDELKRAVKKLGFQARTSLSDLELGAVGIVYNTGGYNAAKGLKQGHFDGSKFYGEALFDFIRLAHTASAGTALPFVMPPAPGLAAILPPTPLTHGGTAMRVKVTEGMLRLRSEPMLSDPPQRNVVGHLPDGHPVRALSSKAVDGFLEVETSLLGALLRGFASEKYLERADVALTIDLVVPQTSDPIVGITAVYAPGKPGVVTKRRGIANALSLNEPAQPGRTGTTAEALRADLGAIIDWLDVENAQFARYQPRDGLTFCNIYAHDFCHLAGPYLPRVWWTSNALVELAKGNPVQPKLGATISEVVANDLFAWLRDFGPNFGWRSTGTLTKLQTEVNQGAVGIIVARRKESKRPGHIAIVAPESAGQSARRSQTGDVLAPLQSQSGSTNFRRGTGQKDWWRGEQFADFAYWMHA